MSVYLRLLEEWRDLLARRPTFGEPLAPYGDLLAAWARWPAGRVSALCWSAEQCRDRWLRGVPLLAEASPAIAPDALEDLLGAALDFLAAVGVPPETLERLAQAWDRGEVGPSALLPQKGGLASESLRDRLGLTDDLAGFVAATTVRPALDAYFAECRPHAADSPWDLGVCPFCGAPPGFADLGEDGRCRLACHVCSGAWVFARMRCPFCGNRTARDLVRLAPEEMQEGGYAVEACKQCGGYVKSLDRRVRWNGGSALIEDWGSPHLDLVAQRAGYWRPLPSLVQLAKRP